MVGTPPREIGFPCVPRFATGFGFAGSVLEERVSGENRFLVFAGGHEFRVGVWRQELFEFCHMPLWPSAGRSHSHDPSVCRKQETPLFAR